MSQTPGLGLIPVAEGKALSPLAGSTFQGQFLFLFSLPLPRSSPRAGVSGEPGMPGAVWPGGMETREWKHVVYSRELVSC